jgi:hypothetical protein
VFLSNDCQTKGASAFCLKFVFVCSKKKISVNLVSGTPFTIFAFIISITLFFHLE